MVITTHTHTEKKINKIQGKGFKYFVFHLLSSQCATVKSKTLQQFLAVDVPVASR